MAGRNATTRRATKRMKRIDSSNADWLVYEEPWSVGLLIAIVVAHFSLDL
jgi:hypothetical protein